MVVLSHVIIGRYEIIMESRISHLTAAGKVGLALRPDLAECVGDGESLEGSLTLAMIVEVLESSYGYSSRRWSFST